MTKIIKKTPAILAIAITTVLSLCITAFAYVSGSGVFAIKPTRQSDGTIKAVITYSGVDDTYNRVSSSGIDVFTTGSATVYKVSFSPSSGAATEVEFCDPDPANVIDTVIVPKKASGMPSSFSTTVTLEPYTSYAINMVSQSSSADTSGTFTIYGLSNVS